jgi:hypothetical protein
MKRLYVAAVVGLLPGLAQAQQGLAPTTPVVPAPVLQNGKVASPAGGWGAGDVRAFSPAKWSPFRNPALASSVEPISGATYAPQAPLPAVPPLPAAASVPEANCGPSGCGGRNGSCWERFKAFLCYTETTNKLPLRPTPFRTPLAGMFPCTPFGGAGCGTCGAPADAVPAAPVPAPYGPVMPGYTMPVPQAPAVGRASANTAGAVAMPSRGAPGPMQPTWLGRVAPESVVNAAKPTGPATTPTVVPTGYKAPAANK